MNLAEIFIKRPVLATVLSITIILFGIIGFSFLGVREYPSVDPPVVTVSTSYPGANADVVENQITEPLEESINGIAGIRTLTSVSRDGASTITVEFEVGSNMEAAANDVRDRVSRAIRNLPPDIDPPRVVKSDADAEWIYAITIQSDRRNLLELSEIANNYFKESLQTIPGVSEIRILGERRYSIKLLIDPLKLAGYSLTPLDVRDALNRENVELPTGRIEGYGTELSVRTFGRMSTEEEFNDMIISESGGSLIRFRDIGRAVFAPHNERSILRGKNGIPMVGLAITPQAGANYIAIVDELYERIEYLKKDMPEDIILGTIIDSTITIRGAIREVRDTILIAFFLVVLVIFFFLREWRTTMIPVFTIPISLIGSFFIMYLAGYSINILTLLSIVLATGLVVDDAIVVLENIYSKIEKGMPSPEAGIKGIKEIFFAVISTTVTLVAVFLPIIFLQGLTGMLFREFGVVMSGTVIISTIVSLTLTPMMTSRWLRKRRKHSRFYERTEKFFAWLNGHYHSSLSSFLKRRWLAFVIMGVAFMMVIIIWPKIPGELAPLQDKGRLGLSAVAPEGVSFERMDKYMGGVISVIDTFSEVNAFIVITSPGFGGTGATNSGFARIGLTNTRDRRKSQQEIAGQLSGIFRNMTFARTIVTQEQTIGSSRRGGLPVQYVIQAGDIERIREILPIFLEKAEKDPAFRVVDANLRFNKPEMTITIERDRARTLGVTVRDIAETLQLYFSGQRIGYFVKGGKQYEIIGQADREFRDKPLDLSTVYVRSRNGELIQLDNLVTVSYRSSIPQIYRFNRYTSVIINADPAENYTLGQGIEAMDRIAGEVLDESYRTSLAGVSRDYQESSNTLMFAFLLALVLIYLVLSAQFESFRDPLIIMVTVPLAIGGALLSLLLLGQTLNIFSQIGMIMLIGIVTKNGILIVEFANQKKTGGQDRVNSAIEAASQRFRPVLMTSLATVLGALPIAMALGAGAKSRVSMGIVIIGGLLFALVLTLYVIPAIYTYLSGKKTNLTDNSG